MVQTIISVDLNKPVHQQPTKNFHNRWHYLIPPVVHLKENLAVRIECFEWTGGQIKNDDNALDIEQVDLTQVHYLSGPIAVENAMPGDILEVELLDLQPLENWGYTGIFDIKNGGGFLDTMYTRAHKAVFEFEGIYALSRHIPGVRFVGLIHPGLIGTAPSQELLNEWNRREKELVDTNPNRIPALANLPNEHGSLVGMLEGTELGQKVKREGARTVPPRENGGNADIKNLSRGSKIWLPVYVEGANLSIGDMHFSQGDGEISFCGGIEMSGAVTLRCKVIKDGMRLHAMKNPIFFPGIVEPRYTRFLTFEGISVTDAGKQLFLDANEAYKQACVNAIEYLKKFGYSGEQVYLLLSALQCEGRINGIVDVPNACTTLSIPIDAFLFDILPRNGGPVSANRGSCAKVIKQQQQIPYWHPHQQKYPQ